MGTIEEYLLHGEGLKIMENPHLLEIKEVRTKRYLLQKSRGVRRKWVFSGESFSRIVTTPSRNIFGIGGTVFCHPVVAEEIRQALSKL